MKKTITFLSRRAAVLLLATLLLTLTARDWTWARLIEDGKALLAIDPDQPTRILSTDKKAQKAGGLCLALKGVPVKPTDDVDVDKEYQLIPIDSL